jgi:nitrate reductase gamma subunit
MTLLLFTQILAVMAAVFCIAAFAVRMRTFLRLPVPKDRSQPRGDPGAGVAYALTLGMMPWAKESTRRHALAYLRGVGFHLMVFLAFGLFLASPWLGVFPAWLRLGLAILCGIGSLLALMGFVSRIVEKSLKSLSMPDDYFAILVVSLFLASSAGMLLQSTLLPFFYLASALVFIYMPLGKIRHCIYFVFSRLFFGRFFGRRGVLPHSQQREATA